MEIGDFVMVVRPVRVLGGRVIPAGTEGIVAERRADEHVVLEWEGGQTCVHVSALSPVSFRVYPAGHGS